MAPTGGRLPEEDRWPWRRPRPRLRPRPRGEARERRDGPREEDPVESTGWQRRLPVDLHGDVHRRHRRGDAEDLRPPARPPDYRYRPRARHAVEPRILALQRVARPRRTPPPDQGLSERPRLLHRGSKRRPGMRPRRGRRLPPRDARPALRLRDLLRVHRRRRPREATLDPVPQLLTRRSSREDSPSFDDAMIADAKQKTR
mmetsp:Transcript_9585/g.31296  ORF Transcript_9585/g.31296 Transcript_9585/m.31296 type:complete len:201 (-) Transcript_9585:31-633(-)